MPRKYIPTGRPPSPPPPAQPGPKQETLDLGNRCLELLDQGVARADLAERLHVTRKRVDHALRTVRRLRDTEAGGEPVPRQRRAVQTPAGPRVNWRWQEDAACKGQPLDLFFDPEGREPEGQKEARTRRAKGFCDLCPVETECREYAIGGAAPSGPWEKHGTWGNLSEGERAALRRKRMKTASNQRLREAKIEAA
jgi:WhiB family redox-sensing transcriptional regulator